MCHVWEAVHAHVAHSVMFLIETESVVMVGIITTDCQ